MKDGISWPGCIVRPVPEREELAHSYVDRVLKLNGLRSCRELEGLLTGNRRSYKSQHTILGMAASLAEIDLPEFVRWHTMAPLTHGIWTKSIINPPEQWCRLGWRLPRGQCFVCPECQAEDLLAFGTAILRRVHQVPGIVYCPIHGKKLLAASIGSYAIGLHSGDPQRIHPLECDACYGRPAGRDAIRRYERLCAAMLQQARPLPKGVVARALFILSKRAGVAMEPERSDAKPMSMHLRELYGADWIDAVWPGGLSSTKGRGACVDRWVRQAHLSAVGYALMLAGVAASDEDIDDVFSTMWVIAANHPPRTKERTRAFHALLERTRARRGRFS